MNKGSVRRFAFALVILIIVIGCAAARKDLVESGNVTILRVPSKQVYLSGVSVVEKNDHVEVSGWVRKRHGWIAGDGHVDVAILNPEGETVRKISTGYYPSAIPKRRGRRSHFKVALPLGPFEKGSAVLVGFHGNDPGQARGAFDCGENVAVSHAEDA